MKRIVLYCLVATAFVIGGLIFWPSAKVQASANSTLNIQGKLVNLSNGTNIYNGSPSCVAAGADTCDLRVSIYTDAAAGTLLWREPHSNVELGDNDGIFNLNLNSICTSWTAPGGSCSGTGFTWGDDSTIYTQIEFDTDGNGDFTSAETFSRSLMTSMPYAYYADSAGSLSGITSTGFVQYHPAAAQTSGDTSASLVWLNESGTGTPNLMELEVGGVDKFIIDNNGRVGIGAAPSTYQLEVTGDIYSTGDVRVAGDDLFMATNTTGFLLVADGTNYNPVDVTGDVDIISTGATTIQDNSVDGTDIALGSDALGDVMYYDGTNWVRLAGSAGFLKSTGAAAPAWSTVALTTDTSGNYVASVAEGNYLDVTGAAGEGYTATVAFDPTELGTVTWYNGTAATDIIWTFDGETNDGTFGYYEDEDAFAFTNSIVGIGTTSPGAKLTVSGTTDGAIYVANTSTGNSDLTLYDTTDGGWKIFSQDGVLRFAEANTAGAWVENDIAINSSGQVGIGDASPDAKLEVLSTTEQLRLTHTDDTTDCRFTVSATGDLTLDCLGSGTTEQLVLGDTDILNIGSGTASDVAYNLIANAADAKDEAAVAADNDLYIGGDLRG